MLVTTTVTQYMIFMVLTQERALNILVLSKIVIIIGKL